jgi:hypothetical protein
MVIGAGTPQVGTFNNINWVVGPFFVNLAVDFSNGVNYQDFGTQQLMSVPYALYAKTSGAQLNQWRYGNTTPASNLGVLGDFYLNVITGEVYYKNNATTWLLTGNIKGPVGPSGAQGVQGTQGIQGAQGVQGTQGVAGANGSNGQNTLVKTTTEAVGVNCTTGGVKIEYGLDANNNGTLDVSEINATLTKYVCNGAQGTPGSQNAWSLTGNLGTSPTTNFIGTVDVKDFILKSNNNERMRITSTGNIGIGTSNPQSRLVINSDSGVGSGVDSSIVFTNVGNVGVGISSPLYKLEIGTSDNFNWASRMQNTGGSGYGLLVSSGAPTSNVPVFEIQNNANTSLFSARSNGNIGIGTTNPLTRLHLVGTLTSQTTSTNNIFRQTNDDNSLLRYSERLNIFGSNTQIDIDPFSTDASGNLTFRFFRHSNTNGSKLVQFLRGNGTTQGSVQIGIDGATSYFQLQGGDFGIGTATPLGKLHVNNNVIGSDSSFVVTTDGKVGIGTSSPTDKVVIEQGGMRINGKFGIGFNDDPYSNNLSTGWEGAKIYWEEGTINSAVPQSDYLVIEKKDGNSSSPDGGIAFANRANNGLRSTSMVISGLGNVGIGTIAPARSLHVNAVMRLEPIPTAPTSPSKGDMYFDSTINKLRVFDGTVWQNCW